jgi:3-dehydroquinate dehydratase-2
MPSILVLNGPNLNLLGTREPGHYGSTTLAEIEGALAARAAADGVDLQCFQSNAEHALVERVQAAGAEGTGFIILNPAAFTHTSVALRDALLATGIPFVELHLSNVHAREPFRLHPYVSDVAGGVICGFGATGYRLAYQAALEHVSRSAGEEA